MSNYNLTEKWIKPLVHQTVTSSWFTCAEAKFISLTTSAWKMGIELTFNNYSHGDNKTISTVANSTANSLIKFGEKHINRTICIAVSRIDHWAVDHPYLKDNKSAHQLLENSGECKEILYEEIY